MNNFTQRLARLAAEPDSLIGIGRGVERETLRVTVQGEISKRSHPIALGKALTHAWITTDFAEQLLEFITPVNFTLPSVFTQLDDLHRFTYQAMDGEVLWPFSMPCYIKNEDDIMLADYGTSNTGKMKTLYRQGLKHRYGSMMQVISGIHFNFSLPDVFWQHWLGEQTPEERQAAISDAYFGLIRNYYRFGWMIPYLFGASPALSPSFLKHPSPFAFETMEDGTCYLPYATSLRMSDLGYTNSAQSALKIGFNGLDEYLNDLHAAIQTPSDDFAKIGMKDENGYRQLNTNILQIENELYAPIRPKRVAKSGENPSEALARAGVEYIEVRSLDVNPYSPVGVDEIQLRFLDMFLIWCTISESPAMTDSETRRCRENWSDIILQGRKPELMLKIGREGQSMTQARWGAEVMDELHQIAKILDSQSGDQLYQMTCATLKTWFADPQLTLSARVLKDMQELGGFMALGCELSSQHATYFSELTPSSYTGFSIDELKNKTKESIEFQKEIENNDVLTFDDFLLSYFKPSV